MSIGAVQKTKKVLAMKRRITMKNIDVIGIGAVNYDYMFQCKKADTNNITPDSGREDIGRPEQEVENEILELYRSGKEPTTQLGGSALLALKAIHAIDNSLSVAYVGVCGMLNDFDRRYGNILNIKTELDFLDNQEWLFYTDNTTPEDKRYIGKSVVRLHRHVRENIKISKGANDLIIDAIKKKEAEGNVSFVDFLSQARWIHVSSLSTFEQFEKIMEYVIKAKEKNRFLKVSIDPGFQYTNENQYELQKHLKIADYVFLSKREYENLIIDEDMDENDKYIKIAAYFNNPENVNTKVFVIKYKNRHELIDFVNATPYVYFHNRISYFRIYNDTGAGDCFAGGFIAGILSDRLIAQQPAAVDLGVLAAKTRMTTAENAEVFNNIESEAKRFFLKGYKNGRISNKKRVIFFWKSYYKSVLTFIGGVLSSFVISAICSVIF